MPKEVRWLLSRARPLWPLLTINLLFMVLGSGLSLLDPLVVRWLIDTALPKRDLQLVFWGTIVFCAVYLLSVGVNYLSSFLSCVVSQKIVFRTRVSLLRRVQALPAQYHGDAQVGETLFRIQQDVDRIAEVSGDILPIAIQMVILGVMVLAMMGALNWRLTVIVAPLLPIFYWLQQKYSSQLKEASDAVQTQSGKMNAFLQAHLTGILQLKLLNCISRQTKRFVQLAAEGARSQIRQRAAEMSFGLASIAIIVLGMGLILGYGGYEVTRSKLTVGGLVAFYGYVFRLFAPISLAIDLQSRLQRVGASIRRILEINDHQIKVSIAVHEPLLRECTPDLEFRSVWFSYDKTRPVLCDMSLRVEAGETVAIVGLNGSGKSTIGLLATHLYEVDSGSILLAGRDIRKITGRSLRSVVTLIPQDPILFDETVRENLLYGNPLATNQELETVTALTQLDDVLRTLPKGLDEPLGPLGHRLSGGERRRLVLARTLLQEPKVLILDEITNALDEPAASGLLRGLETFRQGRTLIIISHRPETVLWAQKILVVDNGSVVDCGKHNELISRSEAYRRIWRSNKSMCGAIEESLWNGFHERAIARKQ